MKELLEDLKARKPRIPLPDLTDDEKQKLGNRADDYEYRLRYHYMPQGEQRGGGFSRGSDPNMSLDYPFKTKLFWIASRMNNCQYCLGHQEIKLAVAGVDEDTLAALDGDWSEFTPKEQAAFAIAQADLRAAPACRRRHRRAAQTLHRPANPGNGPVRVG